MEAVMGRFPALQPANIMALPSPILSGTTIASKRAILEAIESGRLMIESEIALPERRNAAPPPPGDIDPSEHLLYSITRAEEAAITLSVGEWPFNDIKAVQ